MRRRSQGFRWKSSGPHVHGSGPHVHGSGLDKVRGSARGPRMAGYTMSNRTSSVGPTIRRSTIQKSIVRIRSRVRQSWQASWWICRANGLPCIGCQVGGTSAARACGGPYCRRKSTCNSWKPCSRERYGRWPIRMYDMLRTAAMVDVWEFLMRKRVLPSK